MANSQASILVVDDNPLIVNVVKSLLLSKNYHVFTSSHGSEALELLDKKSIDLIICDVMMPKMDGYALHQAIRSRQEFAHIPFVFLTALNDRGEIEKGHESGADEYLLKPFEPQDLLSIVKGKILRSHYLKNLSEERYDSYRKKVLHTLSHEFRTPLVAINTGTELLIDQQDNLDVKKMEGLLEAIRRGGLRLEKLVSDFMVMQQIEAGIATRVYESKVRAVPLAATVTQALRQQQDLIDEMKGQVTVSDRSKGTKVMVYDVQLFDVIGRVLSNALKFSPDSKLVEIMLYSEDSHGVIEIRDRGLGIDLSRLKEATDIFGQLDRDRLEQQGGGLGLAISSRYLAINKGKIDFERREGGGSIVRLMLPLAQ